MYVDGPCSDKSGHDDSSQYDASNRHAYISDHSVIMFVFRVIGDGDAGRFWYVFGADPFSRCQGDLLRLTLACLDLYDLRFVVVNLEREFVCSWIDGIRFAWSNAHAVEA